MSKVLNNKISIVNNRLPYLNHTLSDEQLNFILHPIEKPSYLKACPGSGKTQVVAIKAAYEIASWTQNFSGLAILSFTKNAAKEIALRIVKFTGNKGTMHPHFVGTIDSWLHSYILHLFGHKAAGCDPNKIDKSYRLVDNEDHYDFLNNFQTILSTTPFKNVEVNDYYFECNESSDL